MADSMNLLRPRGRMDNLHSGAGAALLTPRTQLKSNWRDNPVVGRNLHPAGPWDREKSLALEKGNRR